MNFFRKNERITLFADFSSHELKIRGPLHLDLPLERDAQGILTEPCITQCSEAIAQNLPPQTEVAHVYCAIPVRGVSLRNIELPKVSREQIQQLLPFQIEKSFPLSADELTWMACPQEGVTTETGLEITVLAIRKRTVDHYHRVFDSLNTPVHWTLPLLAFRNRALATTPDGIHFHIGSQEAEWIRIENHRPRQLGVIGLGYGSERGLLEQLPDELRSLQSLSADSEALSIHLSSDANGVEILKPVRNEIDASGQIRIGSEINVLDFADSLSRQTEPEKQFNGFHYVTGKAGAERSAKKELYLWGGILSGLFILTLILPLATPFFKHKSLERSYSEMLKKKQALPDIKRELEFLQLLEANRAPYLDAIHVLSRTAPSGTQINRLNLNRRGNVTFEGESQNPNHVEEFRTSLIQSGFFYPVVVDEQTPDERGKKVNFRISAKWKPEKERKPLPEDWMKVEETKSETNNGNSSERERERSRGERGRGGDRGSWRGRR